MDEPQDALEQPQSEQIEENEENEEHPEENSKSEGVQMEVGDWVKTNTGRQGIVRFHGETKFEAGIWLGIELNHPSGKNDGNVKGHSYFKCKPNHGIFVRVENVELLKKAPRKEGVNKDGTYVSNSGLPQLSLCNKCKKEIAFRGIEMTDKSNNAKKCYHLRCFVCTKCNKTISSSGKFFEKKWRALLCSMSSIYNRIIIGCRNRRNR